LLPCLQSFSRVVASTAAYVVLSVVGTLSFI
jgi:hypothetical protein